MIIEKIKERALNLLNEKEDKFKILDFSFALPYSYVLIESNGKKALGVAMTLLEEYRGHKKDINIYKNLEDFINMVDSFDIVERTLGLAAINAVSQYYLNFEANCRDATELVLNRNDIKKIAFIGNMMPVVNMLKKSGKFDIYVFERNPSLLCEDVLSDSFEYRLLPEMDAVFISGTSLLNDTLDFVLDRAKNAKLKILVGPTAQSLPDLFKGFGITHIASTKIVNVDKALLYLKFASSSMLFKEASKKYTIEVK
ncbi:Rossmann-like domain-containing protein [Methanocaldococcus sp. 16A]